MHDERLEPRQQQLIAPARGASTNPPERVEVVHERGGFHALPAQQVQRQPRHAVALDREIRVLHEQQVALPHPVERANPVAKRLCADLNRLPDAAICAVRRVEHERRVPHFSGDLLNVRARLVQRRHARCARFRGHQEAPLKPFSLRQGDELVLQPLRRGAYVVARVGDGLRLVAADFVAFQHVQHMFRPNRRIFRRNKLHVSRQLRFPRHAGG